MTISDRIKSLHGPRERAKFAKILGFSAAYVADIENGRSKPSRALLQAISEKYNVSIDWLLTGKGSRELSPATIHETAVSYQLDNEDYVRIPLISEPIAAGDPLIIDERHIEGFAVIYQKWVKRGHTYRCLRVKGDSMHPVISDGFIVAIDLHDNDPLKLQRQIVAARYEDGVTIKYLLLTDKEYILLPYNTEEYDPIVIPRTAPSPIIGKIAWWYGKSK